MHDVAMLIMHGQYLKVLGASSCSTLLQATPAEAGSVAAYHSLVTRRAEAALDKAADVLLNQPTSGPVLLQVADLITPFFLAGVACLYIYVQHSLDGPSYKAPPCLLQLFAPHLADQQQPNGESSATALGSGLGVDSWTPSERWASQELQDLADGEDLVGRAPAMQYLLLARSLLLHPLRLQHTATADPQVKTHCGPASAALGAALPSWHWWALRCIMSHQQLLSGRSHSLLQAASELTTQLLAWLGDTPAAAASVGGPARPVPHPLRDHAGLRGVLHVELALLQYTYGYIEAGQQYLTRANQLLGLAPQLTGMLGKRTVHQVQANAQLVVLQAAAGPGAANARTAPPSELEVPVPELPSSARPGSELEGLKDESDVFAAPVLVREEDGQQLEARYSGPEQALLLAWATAVQKATSADELQAWEMAPWVEAVLSQKRGHFTLACMARLLKLRHERTRARTRERALLQAECLVELLRGAPPPAPVGESSEAAAVRLEQQAQHDAGEAASRAVLCWAVKLPPQVTVRKEAAEHYVAMGLVGAALREFESLELWDSLLACYRLLGKAHAADELVRARLVVNPNDPKLWCALGDLHLDDKYYEEAWERSGHRHTRSKRSLARSAMRRKDFAGALPHWEAALALNPLHPEAWFSLGFCYLKAERFKDALQAFTRVTQQEPDNGEAWNNIAALWMHLNRFKPAYVALSEAVRYKRNSWQTWENFARAALASDHPQQCVRGLAQCLELSGGQRLYQGCVDGLLDELEGRPKAVEGAADGQQLDGQAATDADGSELQEAAASMGMPLLPLLADVEMPSTGSGDGDAAAEPVGHGQQATAAAGGSSAASDARAREMLLTQLGRLLRQAVNAPCCTPALWGSLARYCSLCGEADSAKEAWLKQVRGLQGGSTALRDEARYLALADASLALCRAYMEGHASGRPGSSKDLGSGRMHLRGLLRSVQGSPLEELPVTAELQACLARIVELEEELQQKRTA